MSQRSSNLTCFTTLTLLCDFCCADYFLVLPSPVKNAKLKRMPIESA
jgi:hypothetical protein